MRGARWWRTPADLLRDYEQLPGDLSITSRKEACDSAHLDTTTG
jgi:hypothetical protein